ncbi:phosphotransferase family protein [Egicoccus halophilus]|uniref:phosphotransferase family protein n=1 Tax=Egicoccus halophilus TaxID=1670830 RepID=UPI0013EE54D6|nr:phosphotransferase family protein [Egicoccus halophilus]
MGVEGIEVEPVTRWLAERASVTPPLDFAVVQGGRSNLTYTVTDADGRRLILRRPPLHGVLQSAHDMGREHRIVSALADADVPVPPTVGHEDDPSVTGAPFYVMEFVDGVVVRDAETARTRLDADSRRKASEDLVDVLVRLHEVDVDAVGLGDLARREDYLARQLKRWHGQLQQGATRELPVLEDVHARLSADIPAQGPATIVHGDYRLDNLILDPATGHVQAVLDWELTTLGDPLADLGLLQVYWGEAGDDVLPLLDSPTVVDGFLTREQVATRYAERSGRDVGELDYYVAFGYWKLACILEGVYSRYASGAYGETDDSFEAFGQMVLALGERAAQTAARAGR